MKNWLKQNLVLAVGLTLPLLLIVLFFVASVLPKMVGTPPQYQMLFTNKVYDYDKRFGYHIDFKVVNSHLVVDAKQLNNNEMGGYEPQLLVFDAGNESVREIQYDAQRAGAEASTGKALLDEAKNLTLDSSPASPDGYTFDHPDYNNGGLVLDMFGGRNVSVYRIKKGAVAYKLPPQNDNYYHDVQFLGWIIKQ